MRKRFVLFLFFLTVLTGACRTLDPEAEIPSYLYVEEFTIDNSMSDMEIFSAKITDVWVYLDNDNQGAYELPAKIPFAESGNHKIELRPGIKNAGIANERRPYPYYELFELSSYKLVPGKTDTIKAITYYDNDPQAINITWEEGFESLGSTYELNPNSDTIVTILEKSEFPDLVFKDNRTGVIYMDESGTFFEMVSPTFFDLPRNNIPIYLEINYKSNQSFIVGLYLDNKKEQIPIYVVKAQEDWNKIYLDFSTYVQQNPPGTPFNVYIGFTRSPELQLAELYLDNIKLIHF